MSTDTTASDWFVCPEPLQDANLRLFCFPFAGGGASNYVTWSHQLPSSIEVRGVQLPGHESRLDEDAHTSLPPLIEGLHDVIRSFLDRPFAFFGHSLGAIIAFELVRQLRTEREPMPAVLIVSGCRGPQVPRPEPPIHTLPDDAFAERIQGFGGTPSEILQDEAMRDLFLPVLRADLAIRETYTYTDAPPLQIPIFAHGGTNDPLVRVSELRAWSEQTSASFGVWTYEGEHFFVTNKDEIVLQNVIKNLRTVVPQL
jgi:medium-chain acyl-[acyl-carrier-protein] hydrolase